VLYKGFQDIVFNLVRKGLNVKVSELTGVKKEEVTTELTETGECLPSIDSDAAAELAPTTIAIEDLQEFGRLREQVTGMAALESNLATFKRLRNGEAEMPDLRALLRYTWKIELPESLDKGGYQTSAMRQGYTFSAGDPGEVFKKTAACAFTQSMEKLNGKFFSLNPVLSVSQDIGTRISPLTAVAGRPDREDEPYADLLRQIDALDAILKSPRARWLVSGERELGPAYEDLLRQVAAVPSLTPRVSDAARARTQAEIDKVTKSLAAVTSEAIGPIVVRGAEGTWALSPDLSGFQSALAVLLKQRFMADSEGRSLEVRVDPRTTVRWDAKRLDDAIAMSEEQRRFLKDNLAKFPNALQDDIRAIADRHLGRRMTDLVAKAELLAPELPRSRIGGNDTAAETHDFDKAGAQLVRLLTLFKEIGANATYDDLTSLLRRDAVRGLVAINRTLDGSELYSVRDGNFLWWQGARNPGLGAFRVADVQALADFLGQQYGQAESLAALSAPLLAVVARSQQLGAAQFAVGLQHETAIGLHEARERCTGRVVGANDDERRHTAAVLASLRRGPDVAARQIVAASDFGKRLEADRVADGEARQRSCFRLAPERRLQSRANGGMRTDVQNTSHHEASSALATSSVKSSLL